MNTKIYIWDLGERDAIADVPQIVWFCENYVKRWKDKKWQTRFWVDLLETHKNRLLDMQAFEMLSFFKSKATDAQLEKRAKNRLETQAKNQLLLAQCETTLNDYRRKNDLLSQLNYN